MVPLELRTTGLRPRDCAHTGLRPTGLRPPRNCAHHGIAPTTELRPTRNCAHHGIAPTSELRPPRNCAHRGIAPTTELRPPRNFALKILMGKIISHTTYVRYVIVLLDLFLKCLLNRSQRHTSHI